MNDDSQQPEQDDDIIGTAFVGSLIVFAVLGIGGYLTFQYLKPIAELVELDSISTKLPSVADVEEIELPQILWTDITTSAGIDFVHENGAAGENYCQRQWEVGAPFGLRYDGDQDLLFVNSQHWPWSDQDESPSLR